VDTSIGDVMVDDQLKYHLKSDHGITIEEFEQMVINQEGRCAICHQFPPKINSRNIDRLFVDHDHNTGRIRGLLCSRCNTGLGLFKDSSELLIVAADYLTEKYV
jgi:hypothetical protein